MGGEVLWNGAILFCWSGVMVGIFFTVEALDVGNRTAVKSWVIFASSMFLLGASLLILTTTARCLP